MTKIKLPQINGLPVIEKYIPVGHPNRPGTLLDFVLAFVFHETSNFNPKATDIMHASYVGRPYESGKYKNSDGKIIVGPIEKGSKSPSSGLGTPFRYGAAQIFIDADSVTVPIPINEVAYGCGDRPLPWTPEFKGQKPLAKNLFANRQNYRTIQFEMCDNAAWDKVQKNTVEFVAQLIVENDLPKTPFLFRHSDITGKPCPSRMLEDRVFDGFKQKILTRVDELKGSSSSPSSSILKKTVVSSDGLNVRAQPNQASSKLGVLAFNASVEIKGIKNGWAEIVYQGKQAFVSDRYLK